jgi:protein-S-isoprenylcysteine O-methyltransferase Ste14
MDDEGRQPDHGSQRRVAVAVVANIVLLLVGRTVALLWSDWLLILFFMGMVMVVIVLAALEARARGVATTVLLRQANRQVLKEVVSWRGRRRRGDDPELP